MKSEAFEEGRKQGEAYAVETIAVTAANKSPGISAGSRHADPKFLMGFYEGIIVRLSKFIDGLQKDEGETEEAE